MHFSIATLCLLCSIVSLTFSTAQACGYSACHPLKKDAINVHLVPHTHDDVGWLKTVDQYFYGQKNSIQRAGVQYILNTVTDELEKNADRRFIYVETEFFHQWWRRQNSEKQAKVKELVKQGRLEFIGGGWTMNDEAAAHYISIIDQMTLGHRFLRQVFGKCGIPKVAWQIDPFGHSREQASLFAQMDFDGLFFGRLDWQEKKAREKNLSMESVWFGSSSLPTKVSSLFTGVLPNGYNPPKGFCFDDTCADEPIVDSPDSIDYNVPQKVEHFIEHVRNQSKVYASTNLIMTMGSDFQYQNANPWFENLDKLISYVNQYHPDVHLLYSTPSCYLKALNEADLTWPTKTDDFFPYSSDPHSFWSGYFTSRPAFKRHERESSAFLQSCKQLQIFAGLTSLDYQAKLGALADAVGISQHHDAITGTEKQHVYSDYVQRLADGERACVNLTVEAIKVIESKKSKESKELNKLFIDPDDSLFVCRALNVSVCKYSESFNFDNQDSFEMPIVIYNQLARFRVETVRIPLVNPDANRLQLVNSTGEQHLFTINQIPDAILQLPERAGSEATHELVFAAHLNALSITSYKLIQTSSLGAIKKHKKAVLSQVQAPSFLSGHGFTLNLDTATSLPHSIYLTESAQTVYFNHSLRYYTGHDGNNSDFDQRASGAYIFRPSVNGSLPIASSDKPSVEFRQSGDWQELLINYSSWAFETIRVHPKIEFIEFDYLVGPIPVKDKIGKEIVAEYRTDIESEQLFTVDSNGRQNIVRKRNHRDTYNYNSSAEFISSNYYPINARASIQDANQDVQLTVLVDRSCGGSSIQDGQLELMLHRRLLFDDAFGVGEALNEPGTDGNGLIVRGRQWVHVGSRQDAIEFGRKRTQELTLPPLILFDFPKSNFEGIRRSKERKSNENISLLHKSIRDGLPDGANLLTVESLPNSRVLIRLEHLYEKGERKNEKPIRIDLRKLFDENLVGKMVSAVEMSLTGSHTKGSIQRLHWKTEGLRRTWENDEMNEIDKSSKMKMYHSYLKDKLDSLESEVTFMERMRVTDFVVSLKPMEIRTYLVRFQ